MFKTLMKKQLMELFRSYFVNKKTGRVNSPAKIVRTFLLFAAVLGLFSYFFSGICSSLADGLVTDGREWLYFSICGIMAVFIGTFGSVFNAYAMIYNAKDNDLLLSMPIPPGMILATKMTGTLFLSLIYESVVFIPSIAEYNIYKPGFSFGALACQLAALLITAFFVTAFTCVFGFVIALAAGRVRNKNSIVILFSVGFFIAYYVFYFKLNSYIATIITQADSIGEKMKSALYPFYALGMGAVGNVKGLIIFLIITAAFFGIVTAVMAKTYINVATSSRGAKKKEYRDEPVKAESQGAALLFREKRRLFGTPVYLLNSGMGILIVPAAAIALVLFRSRVTVISLQLGELVILLPALCTSAACIINSMSNYTSPSVSLEGRNLWILRSLPIETKKILLSKLLFHFRMSIIEAEVFVIALSLVFGISIGLTALIMLITAAYIAFTGGVGLMMNLKNTNLEWTNPTVPVKQDMPVMITLLISSVSALIPGALGFIAIFSGFGVTASLIASLLIFSAASVILYRLIMTKGVRYFEEL